MGATRPPEVSPCVEKFCRKLWKTIVRNLALYKTSRPVLIPGRISPPLSFRRRTAEESAALPHCCRIDFAMLSMKRQASRPPDEQDARLSTCMQVRALGDPRPFPPHPLSGIVSTRSSYLWRH